MADNPIPPEEAIPNPPGSLGDAGKQIPRPGSLLTCIILLISLVCLVVGVILVIGIFKPEWLSFFRQSAQGKSDYLLVGMPSEAGRSDLYLLQIGQKREAGRLLQGQSTLVSGSFWVDKDQTFVPLTGLAYPYGGFIPGTNSLLYWYHQGDQLYLDQLSTDQEMSTNLFTGATPYIWGYILTDFSDIFLTETPNADQVRCHLSQHGTPAVELLNGQNCTLTGDMRSAYAITTANDRFTLQLVNLADKQQYTPLKDQPNVDLYALSADGARLAYESSGQPSEAILINTRNGAKLASSGPLYDVLELNFAQQTDTAYYIAENEVGDVELDLITDQGITWIATSQTLGAQLSQDGQTLLYRSGAVGSRQRLFVRDLGSGKEMYLLPGENLGYVLVDSLQRIFVADSSTEFTFYSSYMDGSNLAERYRQLGMTLEKIQYLPREPFVFLFLQDRDGLYTVYAASTESNDGFPLLEGWVTATLLDISPDGREILLTGQRKADASGALYSMELDKEEVLQVLDSTATSISNAVFTSSGDQVIYTVSMGDPLKDFEIRQVAANGKKVPQTLYSQAFLISAQWKSMDAFQTVYLNGGTAATSFCPGAVTFSVGETLHPNLTPGRPDCFRLSGKQGERVTFWAQGDGLLLNLALYDRKGNFIEPDLSWQDGENPNLVVTYPADGIYFLQLSSQDGSGGPYSLSAIEGVDACAGADEIHFGDLLTGKVSSGKFASYRFNGQAGESYSFWLQDASSRVGIAFFTLEKQALFSFPNLGTYSLTPPRDGSYCLFVSADTGMDEAFKIRMATGKVNCPLAHELILDTPVSGNIAGNSENCYSFTGEVNTLYSLAVASPESADTRVELYDSLGNLLGSDDDSGAGYDPFLSFTPSQGGTYYAVIKGMYPEASGVFELSFVIGTSLCPNPQFMMAGDITSGSLQQDEYQCYSFIARAGEGVNFYLEAEILTLFRLFDQHGNEIARAGETGANFNPHLSAIIPADGTYVITISPWQGTGSGVYTLRMESMRARQSCSQSAQLVFTGDVIDGLLLANEPSCYSLSVPSGQTMLFWVESQVDTRLVLYGPSGSELTRDDDSGGDTNPRLLVTLPGGGVYTLAVEGYGASSGAFTLYVKDSSLKPDAFERAIELGWDIRTRGAVTSEAYLYLQEFKYEAHGVMYTFLGTAGGKIQIDVFADSLGSALDPVINLFDAHHVSLGSDDDSGTGYDAKLIFTLPYTGQYYLLVEDAHDRFGDPSSYFFEILLSR